jgi:hypothetical protein
MKELATAFVAVFGGLLGLTLAWYSHRPFEYLCTSFFNPTFPVGSNELPGLIYLICAVPVGGVLGVWAGLQLGRQLCGTTEDES